MKTHHVLLLCGTMAAAMMTVAPARAKLSWNKKAQEFDPSVKSCIDCHEKAKPKKGEPLSARGKWLVDQKTNKQATEIDLSWLKDYPKK
jgi:cytochrome c553